MALMEDCIFRNSLKLGYSNFYFWENYYKLIISGRGELTFFHLKFTPLLFFWTFLELLEFVSACDS